MRFQSVRCHPFGPFLDETLSLKPGMNVIFGPNEAGKSTWGAALAAGLCGIRRGRGQPQSQDREFAERHRPWDAKEWRLTTVIELAGGRQIELSQDLEGRIDCSAREVSRGRDLSGGILNEGTPDGSKWLGLDRRSFQSVAYLRQGELLSLRDDAKSLQKELHRAAATARTDSTANEALERLKEFRAEQVGSPRAPTKPLVRTQGKVKEARRELDSARKRRAEFEQRRRAVAQLEEQVQQAEMRVHAATASMAETAAEQARQRFIRAQSLSVLFPHGPPQESATQQELASQVELALAKWEALPDPQPPAGPEAVELQRRIAASEARERALRAVRTRLQAERAEERHTRARRLHALFPEGPPQDSAAQPQQVEQVAAGVGRWKALPDLKPPVEPDALHLEGEIEALDSKEGAARAVRTERQAVRTEERLARARRLAALFPDGEPRSPAENAPLAAQAQSEIASWTALPPRQLPAGPSVSDLEGELATTDEAHSRLDRTGAANAVLRNLPGARVAALLTAATACALLGVLLSAIGWVGLLAVLGFSGWRFARRLTAEKEAIRRRLTELTARRRGLERSISTREIADRAYAEDCRRRQAHGERMLRTAEQAGIEVSDPEAAVEALQQWLAERNDEQREYRDRIGKWTELRQELAGETLEEITGQAEELRTRAQELRSTATRAELQAAEPQNLPDEEWAQFERSNAATRSRLETLLEARREEEQEYAQKLEEREGEDKAIVELAGSVGVKAGDPQAAFDGLQSWLRQQSARQDEFNRRNKQWGELQGELGGETLDEVAGQAENLRAQAQELLSGATEPEIQTAEREDLSDEAWARFRKSAAAERSGLETQLGERREKDRAHATRLDERERAGARLVEVASSAGGQADSAESAIGVLAAWQRQHDDAREKFRKLSQQWGELHAVLDGESLEDLFEQHEGLRTKARDLARKVDEAAKEEFSGRTISARESEEFRSALAERQRELHRASGQIEQIEKTLPDLVGREEALAAAEDEEQRLVALDSVLEQTIGFLEDATERIHRDLAPVLRNGVLRWLRRVTCERYTDCRVDPETLAVEVRGPDRPWRSAANLSHGATEQIYLLLRLALAQHLGKREEPCPLILDDPLATSDSARRKVLLETLLTISEERQVILFTHDDDQRQWADENLAEPRHQLVWLGDDEFPA